MRSFSGIGRVAAVGAVIAAAALVALVLFGGGGGGYKVKARFINAGQLVKGNPVQTGGVADRLASTGSRSPTNGEAEIEFEIDGRPRAAATRHPGRDPPVLAVGHRQPLRRPHACRRTAATTRSPTAARSSSDDTDTAVDLDQLFNTLDPRHARGAPEVLQGLGRDVPGPGRAGQRRLPLPEPGALDLQPAVQRADARHARARALPRRQLEARDRASPSAATTSPALIGNLNETTRALGNQKAGARRVDRAAPAVHAAREHHVREPAQRAQRRRPARRRLEAGGRSASARSSTQARAFAADAEPTVRDLSRTVRRRGPANDLIDLLDSFPPLADIAVLEKRPHRRPGGGAVDVGVTRGAFQETVDAFKAGAPRSRSAAPTRTDFLGWVDDFSTTGGGFDALGAMGRGHISLAENLGGPIRTQPVQALPGRAEAPAADGSNVLSAERQEELHCDESARATGDVRMRRVLTILVRSASAPRPSCSRAPRARRARGKTYKIVFDNAFGLVEGGDFQVGGVTAGKTSDLQRGEARGRAAQGRRDRRDHRARLRRLPQGRDLRHQAAVADRRVLRRLPARRLADEKLPDGGTVPVEQTTSTIPPDLVNNILRRPYRERLRLIITELGTGLAGRPEDLAEVLRRAHPGLRETSRVLKILGDQNQVIENFIADADRVVGGARGQQARRGALGRRDRRDRGDHRHAPRGAAPDLREAARPSSTSCARRWRASASSPTSRRRCWPTSSAPPRASRSSSRASARSPRPRGRPSLARRDLGGRHARVPRGHARRSALLQRLRARGRSRPSSRCASSSRRPTTAAARSRTTRARRTAARRRPTRPRSDDGGPTGFTGLEAIWNYFFWQSLSHQRLRRRQPPAARRDHREQVRRAPHGVRPLEPEGQEGPSRTARQWLGPNLPGVTTPDFTEAASDRRAASEPARRAGERRSAGQPDAGPLPGQRDISKPQITLPPDLQELIDELAPKDREDLPDKRPAPPRGDRRPGPGAAAPARADPRPARRPRRRRPRRRPAPRLPARAMRGRRGTASLTASPVLIGAVTLLVTIIAVFIAYNANSGLPFVPTYDVKAELPSRRQAGGGQRGARRRLPRRRGRGDRADHRRGRRRAPLGRRDHDEARQDRRAAGRPTAPCSVRPRSALGLKYVELTPGTAEETYARGDTIPLGRLERAARARGRASRPSTTTRARTRAPPPRASATPSPAAASRSTTRSARSTRSSRHLTPVMRNLSDPDTELDQFFLQIGRRLRAGGAGGRGPGAAVHEHGRHLRRLQPQPGGAPGRRSRSSRPRSTRRSPRSGCSAPSWPTSPTSRGACGPAAQELPRSLPAINDAFRVGTPILPRTVELNERLEGATRRARGPVREPEHAALAARPRHGADGRRGRPPSSSPRTRRSATTSSTSRSRSASTSRRSRPTRAARCRTRAPSRVNIDQPNNYGTIQSSRNVDIPPGMNARGAGRRRRALRPARRAAAPPPGAALQPGHRRAGQRRLPARPGGLPERPLHHRRPLRARRAAPTARRPAATRRSPTRTTRSSRAARSSRSRTASTTSGRALMARMKRRAHDGMSPLRAGHPRARRARRAAPTSASRRPTRSRPVRARGGLPDGQQPEAELAGADRRRGRRQGQERRGRGRRHRRRPRDDGDRGEGPADPRGRASSRSGRASSSRATSSWTSQPGSPSARRARRRRHDPDEPDRRAGAVRRPAHGAPARHARGPPDLPRGVRAEGPRERRRRGLQRLDPVLGGRLPQQRARQRRHARAGARPRTSSACSRARRARSPRWSRTSARSRTWSRTSTSPPAPSRARTWRSRPRSPSCATRCASRQPALASLNASLPSVRAFARDALPGVRSSDETLAASLPFITQARRLMSPDELRGLAAELRLRIPALVALNRESVPVLGESRQLSACTNKVLVPFVQSKFPNVQGPDGENGNGDQQVRHQLQRGLVGPVRREPPVRRQQPVLPHVARRRRR